MPQIPFNSLRATFVWSLLVGETNRDKLVCVRSVESVQVSSKCRRLALIGSFTWSESPSATRTRVEICRFWTDMRNTCKMRLSMNLASRQMESNRRERPYITISTDLRHGAGRARRRTFRESLLKRLSWFESSRLCFFALRSHLRHSRSREKEERTEQFRNIDIYKKEKWSGREGASRTSRTSREKEHAGRVC